MLGPAFCANNRGDGTVCLQARARYCENNVLSVAVLTDIGRGIQPLVPDMYTFLFPYWANAVFAEILPDAKPQGQEGLDSFFFFDKFCLCIIFIKNPFRRGKRPDLR